MKDFDLHKIGWFTFYILWPLGRVCGRVAKAIHAAYLEITGRWWCDGCRRNHSRRTVAYHPDGWGEGIAFCYKHVDPAGVQHYEYIAIGDRNVTQRAKDAHQLAQSGLDSTPPPLPAKPTDREVLQAAKVLGDFCTRQSGQGGCKACALLDMCSDPPYTWEVET